eukprot:TRINITY_DN93525_c0_g1_i1.p1 TRINITY_DN93525_c0_g1~~TRINITY_DN93525_c0_g1_i1.p1  ORF type:complete len:418 (-),score=7.82 TRINITY_DN93525_c0_g1_i1:164-1417(-)
MFDLLTLSQIAFCLVLIAHALFWGFLCKSKRYDRFKDAIITYVWYFHGPHVHLTLLFFFSETYWKYAAASVLVYSLWECGTARSDWDWKTCLKINLHHVGAVVALIYQQTADEALVNCVTFGWIWDIHGFGFFENVLLPFFGLKNLKENHRFLKYVKHFYAAVTVILVHFYLNTSALQQLLSRHEPNVAHPMMPGLGLNYRTAAILCMFTGRFLCGNNYKNIAWMRRIEAPGVLLVALTHAFGATAAICALGFAICWLFLNRPMVPHKLVLTPAIKAMLAKHPKSSEPHDTKEVLDWFERDGLNEKRPLHKAAFVDDQQKVQELLDSGVDVDARMPECCESTPIQWASSFGNLGVVIMLIEAGADPYYRNEAGNDCRADAKREKHQNVLEFLDKLDSLAFKVTPPSKLSLWQWVRLL